jgi:peptidoglycan/LPS O-acetylase OafA/YrhL
MPLIAWSARGSNLRTYAAGAGFMLAGLAYPPLLFGTLFVIGARLPGQKARSRFLENPLSQWLGKVSYSLYLSHWLVIKLCCQLFGLPGVALGTALAAPVAWLVWRTVEKPSIDLSRRVFRIGANSRPRLRRAEALPLHSTGA